MPRVHAGNAPLCDVSVMVAVMNVPIDVRRLRLRGPFERSDDHLTIAAESDCADQSPALNYNSLPSQQEVSMR
jgi:hypothetical protein